MSDKLAEVFGNSIQRQMNQDMGDMMTEMARTNSHARNTKIVPAYEEVDVFERHRIEHQIRLQRDQAQTNAVQGRLIQPDDPLKPKARVILPNE